MHTVRLQFLCNVHTIYKKDSMITQTAGMAAADQHIYFTGGVAGPENQGVDAFRV